MRGNEVKGMARLFTHSPFSVSRSCSLHRRRRGNRERPATSLIHPFMPHREDWEAGWILDAGRWMTADRRQGAVSESVSHSFSLYHWPGVTTERSNEEGEGMVRDERERMKVDQAFPQLLVYAFGVVTCPRAGVEEGLYRFLLPSPFHSPHSLWSSCHVTWVTRKPREDKWPIHPISFHSILPL